MATPAVAVVAAAETRQLHHQILLCLLNLFLYNKKTEVSVLDWDFTFAEVSSVNLQLLKGGNGLSESYRCSKSVENPEIINMTNMNQQHLVPTRSWMEMPCWGTMILRIARGAYGNKLVS